MEKTLFKNDVGDVGTDFAPLAAEFESRANLHRPTDPAALAAAVRSLHRGGLAARDVAMALRVPIGLVLEALAAAPLGGVPYA